MILILIDSIPKQYPIYQASPASFSNSRNSNHEVRLDPPCHAHSSHLRSIITNLHHIQSIPLTTLKAPVASHYTDTPSTATDPAATADQQAQILRRCQLGHSHGGMEVPLYCPNGVDDVEEEDEQETIVKRNHIGVGHVEGVDAAEMPDDLISKRVAEPSHDEENDGGVH